MKLNRSEQEQILHSPYEEAEEEEGYYWWRTCCINIEINIIALSYSIF